MLTGLNVNIIYPVDAGIHCCGIHDVF